MGSFRAGAICDLPAFNRCGINPWMVYLSKSKSPPTFSIKFAREDFSPTGFKDSSRYYNSHPHDAGLKPMLAYERGFLLRTSADSALNS